MRTLGNDLILGRMPGRDRALGISASERDKHLYICGGTGTGKSKFLENLIRQDITNWSKSKCGMLVLDPHGNLYDNLINWLAWTELQRPIIPIDLRQDDWVVAYNVVRQRQLANPSVLVDNLIAAMAYVWGQGGTDQTPLFARWAENVIRTLYEKKLTLVESEHLIDRIEKQIRYQLTADLKHKPSRQDWQFADTLSAKDFEAQIGSTVNRLRRILWATAAQSEPPKSCPISRSDLFPPFQIIYMATLCAAPSSSRSGRVMPFRVAPHCAFAGVRSKVRIRPFEFRSTNTSSAHSKTVMTRCLASGGWLSP
jgi:hypothetical protein